MARFRNKVVIVTGSSSGIGRATAILFAKEAAKVVITGRNAANLKETEKDMVAAGGSEENILPVVGDITNAEFIRRLVCETITKFEKINILVNNAGATITDPTGKKDFEADIDILNQNLQLNLISVVQLIQYARPHLIASKGEIVNVSSMAALDFAHPTWPFYAISKAALDQASRSLAIDLIKHGVRLNTVNPGVVETKFLTRVGIPETATSKAYGYLSSQADCIPAGHVGSPQEIAEVISFLADRKRSSYIIGQNIVADGGTSLLMAMNAHDLSKVLSK